MLSNQKSTACMNFLFTLFNRVILSSVQFTDLNLFFRWVYFSRAIHFYNSMGNSINKLSCISLNMYLSKYCLGLNLGILLSLWESSNSWTVNHLSIYAFMGCQHKKIPFLKTSCYIEWYIPPNLIFWVITDNITIVGYLWDDPVSKYRITNNPSTTVPYGYQKKTQLIKCIAHSHLIWVQWVAAGLRFLQIIYVSLLEALDLLVVSPQTLIRY
jgi:hypothetical protein